jgi:DNA-binding transcriptional MerR regulator
MAPYRGGRPKGVRNKVSRELGEAARTYTDGALERLWEIACQSVNLSASVAAIKEILDRGHGKAVQPLAHSGDVRITHEQALKLIRDRLDILDTERDPLLIEHSNGHSELR